jgi:replication factor A1
VLSGLLSDGTATVRFTWWDPPREGVDRGTVLRATQFTVREFGGKWEVGFNARSRVEEASAAELEAPGLGELPLRPVAELHAEDEGFRVRVRVVKVAAKSVRVEGRRREIYEGTLADRSGAIGFTAWADFRLAATEEIEIGLARVATFRGSRQLVVDGRSVVDRIDPPDLPPAQELAGWPKFRLGDLEASRGAERAEAEGVIVALMPPSGVVYRCPECSRSLKQGACREHGRVAGVPDLRSRIVLDDGTAAVTLNVGRAETERLAGRTLEEYLRELREVPDPSRVEEDLLDRLFGRRVRVRGVATADSFGVTITPEEMAEPPGPDPSEVASLLLRAAGGRQ